MSSEFETVNYVKEGHVGEIILNRPKSLNAFNIQMRDELYQILEAVRDDPEIRSIVLRGEGERAFCTGADLKEFDTAPSRVIAREVRWERDLWGLFIAMDKPIIAALHGFVIGSGLEMAMLCDIRLCTEDASFSMPEAALGMLPAAGGTQSLPRAIGRARALGMLLKKERIDAKMGYQIGLVHRVVHKNSLRSEALAMADVLAKHPPKVVGALKESIRRGLNMPLARAMELELNLAIKTVGGNE